MNNRQLLSPTLLAFLKGLNKPVAPKQSSTSGQQNQSSKGQPKQNNFQTFILVRQNFRNAFASGVLRPDDFAHRIQAMVTAATIAILEDAKKRNINAILGELCKDGKLKPFSVAEALAFLWVYVGTVEEVTRRSGPIFCRGVLSYQLEYLFRQAVAVDKGKNMQHVAYLWKKVRKCNPPSEEFPSHGNTFKNAYGGVDLDVVWTPEKGMEQFFGEILSVNGVWRNPSSNNEQQSGKDATPKTIMKPTLARKDDKSVNLERSSTSKPRPRSDFVQQNIQELTSNNPAAANLPLITTDSDALLFLTNPAEYIGLNPSLFPSSKDVTWSARKLLPEPPTKRNKPNPVNDPVPEPEVAQTPADCTETLLRVDFTPEEYVDQTTAPNYYAQGVKIVDGVRRVVFYHKMINSSYIKKEPI